MNSIVGLDVGTKTITGAVFGRSGKRLRLIDFFVEPVPELKPPPPGAPSTETVDLERSVPMSLPEAIKLLLASRGLMAFDVVVSLDAKDCIIRELVMDFTKDSDIQRTIKFEAENYLVTMDVDDMVLEYLKVREQNGKSQLILVAARNQAIDHRLKMFKDATVDPISMDLDVAALFNAFALTPAYKNNPDNNCLLIDMGKTTTKVLLIEKGRLKKVRSLRMGGYLDAASGRQLAQPAGSAPAGLLASGAAAFPAADASTIEARFEEIETALRKLDPLGGDPLVHSLHGEDAPIAILSDEEYERITEMQRGQQAVATAAEPAGGAPDFYPGGGPGDPGEPRNGSTPGPNEPDYERYLNRLGLEIQRTFTTSLIESPVDLICLTGGMSARDEACEYFQKNFDVETIRLDFGGSGDSFEVDAKVDASQLAELNRVGALAVGLAVKELGADQIGFDFRKNQFRYERKFERLKYPLLLAAILICACFLQTAVDLLREYQSLELKTQTIRQKSSDIYKNFFGETNDSVLMSIQARSKKSQWDQVLGVGGGDIPIFIDEIESIKDISEVFREAKLAGLEFEVDVIDMKFRTRQRSGVAGNQPAGLTLQAESDSSISLSIGDSRSIGSELVNLFKTKSKLWEVSPSESRSPDGKVKVVLKLTPKESYLRGLRS